VTERSLEGLREIAGAVSRETFEGLLAFEQEFVKWSRRINLTARSTHDSLWRRHILDSAQLERLAPDAKRWLDLGSGGGFPGAVIAILLRESPGAVVDLVDSNRKKAAFLQATLAKLNAPARIHALRIEDVSVEIPDIVTARALAPLPLLLELSKKWLGAGSRGLFHKGRDYRGELEECRDAWRFDLVEHQSAIAPEGVILEIAELRPA
jgi:16S rRNA (guanine527-N7)-methyltransferase